MRCGVPNRNFHPDLRCRLLKLRNTGRFCASVELVDGAPSDESIGMVLTGRFVCWEVLCCLDYCFGRWVHCPVLHRGGGTPVMRSLPKLSQYCGSDQNTPLEYNLSVPSGLASLHGHWMPPSRSFSYVIAV